MADLLLIRHAKSDWHAPFADDRQRPLNERGRQSAAAIGRFLERTRRVPDVVVTSPAVRTRATVEIATGAGSWTVRTVVDDRLYGGGADAALGVIREHGGAGDRLALVGHEPTLSTLASGLIGGGAIRIPTGAVVALDLPDLAAAGWRSARLLWMIVPRLLTDGDLDLGDP